MTPPPRHTAFRTPPSMVASAPSTPSMDMFQAMLQDVAGMHIYIIYINGENLL